MVEALNEVVGVSLKPVFLFNEMFESRGYPCGVLLPMLYLDNQLMNSHAELFRCAALHFAQSAF
jgi:hypothetical protein